VFRAYTLSATLWLLFAAGMGLLIALKFGASEFGGCATNPTATGGPHTGLGDTQIYNFTLGKFDVGLPWACSGLISKRSRE
jgi:hypothetical protein